MKRTNTGPTIYKTEKVPYAARIAVFLKQSTDRVQKGKPEEESVCYKNACM